MANKITAISGFPEYLPAEQLAFNSIVSKVQAVYAAFGYVPLETAAVERIDTLTAKGIDSKEVYALRRLNVEGDDDGAKELALRFDLTIPLARYVSQHYANLVFPFRRYQVQPVWRGERPKAGRYRQFHQLDLDYVTEGALPLAADAEVIAAAHQALAAILPSGTKFKMRINNRKLLQGLLKTYKAKDLPAAIRAIDNLEKVGADATQTALVQHGGLPAPQAEALLQLLREPYPLEALKGVSTTPEAQEGIAELELVLTRAQEFLAPRPSFLVPDLTIARGLDYYTGTVLETTLEAAPELGSICSGGRYDNLAESLSSRALPGVGVSIGLSRLFAWLKTQAPYNTQAATTAQVLVANQSADLMPYYTQLAAQLRAAGIATEQVLAPLKLATQLKNAAKKGISYAVIANDEEQQKQIVNLKNLATEKQQTLPLAELLKTLQPLLA